MQHISDNEFDRLFRDNLEDAEVQPSASLWDRIEPQIAAKKRNKSPYLWMAAASVVVALSAGLLFVQFDGQPAEVVNTAKIKSTIEVNENPDVNQEVVSVEANKTSLGQVKANIGEMQTVESGKVIRPALAAVNQDVDPSMVKDEKSLIAMQPVSKEMHLTNTTPVQEPELAIESGIVIADTETVVASTEKIYTNAIEEVVEVEQPEKARIRNAGDLVNYVVDKIDKRDQKILEFKTDDDDNSSLIAINIGPFKLNQRKHK